MKHNELDIAYQFSVADFETFTVTSPQPQQKIYGIFLADIKQRSQWRVFNSSSAVRKSMSRSMGADLVGEQLTKYVWFSCTIFPLNCHHLTLWVTARYCGYACRENWFDCVMVFPVKSEVSLYLGEHRGSSTTPRFSLLQKISVLFQNHFKTFLQVLSCTP